MTHARLPICKQALGGLPALLFFWAIGASAAPAPADFRLAVAHSDNIARSPDFAAVDETWLEAGVTGTFAVDRARFDAELVTDIAYRKYTSGNFNDEFVGGANAKASLQLVGETFIWVANDVYGQSSVNAFALDSPLNRQSTNFFSTGPEISLPVGDRTRIHVTGSWAKASYETTIIDSTRKTGTLGIERRTSGPMTLRLQGSASRVEFDDSTTNSPFDVQEVSLGMHREEARTTVDAEIGETMLHNAGKTNSALLARVTLVRRTSINSTLTLSAGKEYSDSAQFFRLRQLDLGPGGVLGNATAAADPLRSTYANLAWVRAASRSTLRVVVDWRKERRDVAKFLNVERSGVLVGFNYRMSALFDGGIFATLRRDEFSTSDTTARERDYGANLGWRLGPRLRATAVYVRTHGTDAILGVGADENRITVSFAYAAKR